LNAREVNICKSSAHVLKWMENIPTLEIQIYFKYLTTKHCLYKIHQLISYTFYYKIVFHHDNNRLRLALLFGSANWNVISHEHPMAGGGGVSGSRFNVRDGLNITSIYIRVNHNPNHNPRQHYFRRGNTILRN